MKFIDNFSLASGLQHNQNKSALMSLNCSMMQQAARFGVDEKANIKILGLRLSRKWSETADLNFGLIMKGLTEAMRRLSGRRLNIIQKVWMINTFVLSKLWLTWNEGQSAKFTSAIGKFLWLGHLYRVAMSQVCLKVEEGGLGLIAVKKKCLALFLKNATRSSKRAGNAIERDPFLDIRVRGRKNIQVQSLCRELVDRNDLVTAKDFYLHLLS